MEIKVLDHGFVKLVETWGSEEQIIEAARMSTGKGFLGWGPKCRSCGDAFDEPERDCPKPNGTDPLVDCGRGGHSFDAPGDEKLLRFLWENRHATPFEMAGMTIEVQAPIFVFREWHRHRVPFGYNEMSSRYTPLPDVNYVSTVERLLQAATDAKKRNKQAGVIDGAAELTLAEAEADVHEQQEEFARQEAFYQRRLQRGVTKELARTHIAVGRYSKMRATSNLRGWLAFLTLRMAPGAQLEIRVYAEAVGKMIAEKFPRTWGLFSEKRQ